MSRKNLMEARRVAEATPVQGRPGRFRVQLITPGWGSSGYYPAEVLEAAGRSGVFPAGLHMYLDHPTRTENSERPERSVRDLAAVLTEAATWNPSTRALEAEAAVFGPYREVLAEMAEAIGVSIRAAAEVEHGEAEGRRGTVVTELVEGVSADFVTHAGRGGRIVEVLESAHRTTVAERRSIGQWIESRIHRDFTITADDMAGDGRLTREERISLSNAIGDALTAFVGRLGADQPQLYARDLWDDPQDTIAAAIEAVDEHDNTVATLEREIEQAREALAAAGHTDVPVNPAGQSNTQESEEDTMPQIEEARLRELEEAAGRVTTVEAERDSERQAREAAERELAAERARGAAERHARSRVTEANSALAPATVDRIVTTATATVPLTESGQLDTAALDTAVDEARTAEETYLAGLAESAGTGRVRGFGRSANTTQVGDVSEADVDAIIRRRAGTDQKGS